MIRPEDLALLAFANSAEEAWQLLLHQGLSAYPNREGEPNR